MSQHSSAPSAQRLLSGLALRSDRLAGIELGAGRRSTWLKGCYCDCPRGSDGTRQLVVAAERGVSETGVRVLTDCDEYEPAHACIRLSMYGVVWWSRTECTIGLTSLLRSALLRLCPLPSALSRRPLHSPHQSQVTRDRSRTRPHATIRRIVVVAVSAESALPVC